MSPEIKTKKLNDLLSCWVPGTVYTSSWLKLKGYGSDLLNRYKKSGWISSLGQGAYVRFNDTPAWDGGVYALQKQLNMRVHVGGLTALQLQGYGHYIAPKLNKCYLYTPDKRRLPKWFRSYNWDVEIKLHISTLFEEYKRGIKEINRNQIPVQVSTPERAILEMISHVQSEAGFMHVWQIMEGLATLRPALMQELLEACNSVKVTRLCLYMGEKNQLQWVERLNQDNFELGSGKRSVVKGGKLNHKYQITVPEKLEEEPWI